MSAPLQNTTSLTHGFAAFSAALQPILMFLASVSALCHAGEAGVQVGVAWVAPWVQGVTASPASPLLL